MKEALEYNDGPVVIHAEVASGDNVYPMIPAGAALKDMLLGPPVEKLEKPEGVPDDQCRWNDAYAHNQSLCCKQGRVLNRLVLVFSRRGWNIDSLSVSPIPMASSHVAPLSLREIPVRLR